jgi:hypothetical protein
VSPSTGSSTGISPESLGRGEKCKDKENNKDEPEKEKVKEGNRKQIEHEMERFIRLQAERMIGNT